MIGFSGDSSGRSFGVYVHVPWCRKLCPYCDFAVEVGEPPHERYLDAIRYELDARAAEMSGQLVSIYFGGGTPSLWRADCLARAIAAITERFAGRPDEITRVRTLLATVAEPTKSVEILVGRVASITDTGRLELRTEDGKISIRFPLGLTDQVSRLTITGPANLEVETAVYWDAVQRREIYKRQLIAVK